MYTLIYLYQAGCSVVLEKLITSAMDCRRFDLLMQINKSGV